MLSEKPREVYRRAWKKKNPGLAYEAMKRWIKRHPGRQNLLSYRWRCKKFGVLDKDFKDICEVCGGLPTGRCKRLSLDHCHKTKKFRGFLCNSCNSALGLLKDDAEIVLKLLKYIRRTSWKALRRR